MVPCLSALAELVGHPWHLVRIEFAATIEEGRKLGLGPMGFAEPSPGPTASGIVTVLLHAPQISQKPKVTW